MLSSIPGLVAELEAATGEAYAAGIDESIEGDENRGRFAVALIKRHRPGFATVYLTGLDHQQHGDGPGSAPAHAVLERIDTILGQLIAAERAVHPGAVIAVVSDHGFAPVSRETNLFRAFIDAGLITLGPDGKVVSWTAMPWPSGGSAAVVLADPKDVAALTRTSAVLSALTANPANGIAEVIRADEIGSMRGNPQAAFFVNFKPGTSAGNFSDQASGVTHPARNKGTHGWFPAMPEMRATFMLIGPSIPKAHALGEVDQRAIAPTLARIMGVRLNGAEVPAITY